MVLRRTGNTRIYRLGGTAGWVLTGVTALTMASCASPNTTARSANGAPAVWVGSDATDVFMIQMTRQANTLSGTLDDVGLNTPAGTTTIPLHAGFTGTVDGTVMTLDFSGTSIAGTVSDSKVSLHWPQSQGSVVTLTLKPGTVDGYNQKAAALRNTAGANASASAAADARRRTQAGIDAAAAAVTQDMSRLASANKTPDFASFDRDLAAARNDLAQTKADAAKAAGESDRSNACYDASTALYDAGTVQYDSGSIDYDANEIAGDVDAVNNAASRVNSDLLTYQQAAATLPDYKAANAPDPSAVKSLADAATKAAAGWKTKAAQYQSQVAQLVNQANTVATHAQNQYC